MRRNLVILLCSVSFACERLESLVGTSGGGDAGPAAGDASVAGDAAPAGDPAMAGDATGGDGLTLAGDGAPILAASGTLPAGWNGNGVLAKRTDKLPRGAPAWAAVLAEVVERDKQRFLQTTGRADRIKNKALARTTAENRARAEMVRWVASSRLVGTQVIAAWQKKDVTLARVAMPVPADWVPGQTVPGAPPGGDEPQP